ADRRAMLTLVDRLHRSAPHTVMHFRHYQAIPGTTFGDRVVGHHGPLPTSLSELERWRTAQTRMLPWLVPTEAEEERLRIVYLLPLGYGDGLANGQAQMLRRVLRRAARLRCRTGFLRMPIDRRVFTQVCARGLRSTWLS